MLDQITKTRPASQVLTDAPPRPTVKKTTADWFHECVLRGRKEVFCEIVTLTPDTARFLLAANTSNRLIKTNVLETYKQDIAGGRWALNGEAIKVARNGDLIDGQHRCWAVVETEKAIKTLIMFGIDTDARMTIDQGASRTAADYLSMEGDVKYATHAAGVARALFINRTGLAAKAGTKHGVTKLAVRSEYWTNEREIASALSFALGSHKCPRSLGGTAVPTALVLARRISPNADDFFDKYLTGADLPKGSPILAARNRLASLGSLRLNDKVRIILHAFEAWLQDRPLQNIKLHKAKKRSGK